jgi:TetR/AcrR family transcriptional regulator
MSRAEADQRLRILEAAVAVFGDLGLRGATIRRVGKEAGVNSALIYYYFENKETLFVEALHHVLRGFLAFLQQRQQPFTGAAHRIRFLVEALFDYFSQHPERMRLLKLGVSSHPDLFGRLLSRVAQEDSLIPIMVLGEGMARGELKPLHPVAAWWSILGMCLFNLEIQQVVRHLDLAQLPMPIPDLDQRKEAIVMVLTDGLAIRPANPISQPT